jgi:hypothetical protein
MLRENLTCHCYNTEQTTNDLWPLLGYGAMMNDGRTDKRTRWERNRGERKKGDKKIEKWQNRDEGTVLMVKKGGEGRVGGNKDEQIRKQQGRKQERR